MFLTLYKKSFCGWSKSFLFIYFNLLVAQGNSGLFAQSEQHFNENQTAMNSAIRPFLTAFQISLSENRVTCAHSDEKIMTVVTFCSRVLIKEETMLVRAASLSKRQKKVCSLIVRVFFF